LSLTESVPYDYLLEELPETPRELLPENELLELEPELNPLELEPEL
jgi:hypothetical protein